MTLYLLGVQSDSSAESFAPPSTDLQLQSLSSSTAASPTNQDSDNTTQLEEEELCSSLAQLNLQKEGSGAPEETQFTKRHDCVQKSEDQGDSSIDRDEQNERLTGLHHHKEKQGTDISNSDGGSKGMLIPVIKEDGECESSVVSGDLEGMRTSDRLAEEKGREVESGDEVLEWRISDVFSGLDNESPKTS